MAFNTQSFKISDQMRDLIVDCNTKRVSRVVVTTIDGVKYPIMLMPLSYLNLMAMGMEDVFLVLKAEGLMTEDS